MLAVFLVIFFGVCIYVYADCFHTHIQKGKTAMDIAEEKNKSAVVALLEK